MSEPEKLATIPLLPIKNTVLFPHMLLPLSVGRPNSVAAVEQAMCGEEKHIVIVAQRDASVDDPRQQDLFTVGTKGVIKKLGRRPDGVIELVVQGLERVTIVKVEEVRGAMQARVQTLPAPSDTGRRSRGAASCGPRDRATSHCSDASAGARGIGAADPGP